MNLTGQQGLGDTGPGDTQQIKLMGLAWTCFGFLFTSCIQLFLIYCLLPLLPDLNVHSSPLSLNTYLSHT